MVFQKDGTLPLRPPGAAGGERPGRPASVQDAGHGPRLWPFVCEAWGGSQFRGLSSLAPASRPACGEGEAEGQVSEDSAGSGGWPCRHGLRLPPSLSCGVLPAPAHLWAVKGSAPGARGPRTAGRCHRPCVLEVCPGQHLALKLPAWPWARPWGQACPVPEAPRGPAGHPGALRGGGLVGMGEGKGLPRPTALFPSAASGRAAPSTAGGAAPRRWDSSEAPRLSRVTGRSPDPRPPPPVRPAACVGWARVSACSEEDRSRGSAGPRAWPPRAGGDHQPLERD